jgi:hypothetical protein
MSIKIENAGILKKITRKMIVNKRYKELTVKLCKQLQLTNYKFLLDHLKEEENTTDIINLVLSGHLSSLFSCMIEVASDHEEHLGKVNKFIANLHAYISTLEPISKVEVL